MDYSIKNEEKIYFYINQKISSYIKSERKVRKIRVIKAIKIKFTLFNIEKKLVIYIFTGFIRNKIDKNTVYSTLRIDNKSRKNEQVKMNIQ